MKLRCRIVPHILLALTASFLFTLQGDAQQAPQAGRNVNMVSGSTSFKDGDPFLQRQNEVSIAVSSRNVQHLFAGANDYRTVDLSFAVAGADPDVKVNGDAWLGVFKSFDGGSSWKSELLPGYPQDTSAEGAASPIKGFTTASDPYVRGGTNGLFYYSGIAFNRDNQQKGVFFVARFIDNNNKENGDSIRYLNTIVVDRGAAGRFIDKPTLAVDVPRSGAGTCSIQTTQDGKLVNQAIPAGNVYVAYSEFVGRSKNINARILFARSTDCGASWSGAIRITEGSPIVQGATIAIDPNTGYVYVAWRQIRTYKPDGSIATPDGMWIAKSVNQGASFSTAVQVAQIVPFDQDTNEPPESFRQFRTSTYPAMTVDATGRVYVAWSQYGVGADGGARIAVKTSMDGHNWSGTPTVLTDSPPSPKGHQIMPSLTFAAGKLMMTYYDFRDDLAYAPPPVGAQPAIPSSGYVRDPIIVGGRPYLHTMDARAAQADPGDAPLFVSTQISRYLFDVVGAPGQRRLRQLQYNPPNLPLFDQGTKPFIGDYIDIAPPPFVLLDGHWQWNTAPSKSAAFHAAWTDNRDVKPPVDYDWTRYTAPGSLAGAHSIFDPSQTLQQCVPSRAGMRDQNVYTSRITQGLIVTVPGNSKPLGKFQRAYVVFVQNTSRPNFKDLFSSVKYFRLTIQTPLPADTSASFLQFHPLYVVDVTIRDRSSIARSVFVTSNSPNATVTVKVEQIERLGAPAPLPGGLASSVVINPDILNPDILNPDILNPDPRNPDILNAEVYNPDILNQDPQNPDILNTVEITSVLHPDILNPDILNPDILNPDILNPDILNPDILNPDILNPDILNPDILNPDILNPDILNPDILNPDILNSSIADVKDIIWKVTNKGNTTSAFTFRNFVNRNPKAFAFQLLVYKIYATPTLDNCSTKPTMHQELVVNILNPDILNPDILNPDILNPDILNASFYLAPFESAKVALRVIDKDKNDAVQVTVNGAPIPTPTPGVPQVFPIQSVQIGAAVVNAAIVAQEVNTEDAAQGVTSPPAATARLTIVTQELPSGRVGQAYSATLMASGGTTPYTWTVLAGQGATPNSIGASGLTLNSATGQITGTPVSPGTFSFSVQVTDAAARIDRRDLAIAVFPALGTPALSVVSQPNPCFDTANPQPTCVRVNQVIVPAVSVKAIGSDGAGVPGVQVTLSIGSAPIGAILSGTLVRTTNADGVAVFDDLRVNQPGTYKLSAAAAGYTAASTGNFNVVQQIFIVGNTNDSGPGSLRQAMLDTNASGPSQILFNIPGPGPYVIQPSSPLPVMTRPVSIDGTTQPGYAGHPTVQIDGSLAGVAANGLVLTGGSSLVRGLAIGGFNGNGIMLNIGGTNRIAGNYLGTNLAGSAPFDIGGYTIYILNSANNTIGGTTGTTPGGTCTGDCNVIVGRALNKASVEIEGAGSDGNRILGNFVGTDVTGNNGLNGQTFGISVANYSVPNTVVGDGTPAGRNVISGNVNGIYSTGRNTSIKGNYIGTNAAGTTYVPNTFGGFSNPAGIYIYGGQQSLIENNLLSGNNGTAVAVVASAAGTTIRGNNIGLNAARDAVLGNVVGITIEASAHDNVVGGTTSADRNIISGNSRWAVFVGSDPKVTGNRIIGNYIGTDPTGTMVAPNGTDPMPAYPYPAVWIASASGNSVGGTNPGEGNVIAFNTYAGVAVTDPPSNGNSILGNSIFGNGGLGIGFGTDVFALRVTPNDPLDADTGPNNLQNFPVINFATPSTVTGTLNSTANTIFRIQLFKNSACDPSGYGEGQALIASFSLLTDASGNASFLQAGLSLANGQFVTATATDPNGNTSEFSLCEPVTHQIVSNTNDSGAGSLRQAMLDANASSGPAQILFNFSGPAPYVIQPSSPLPTMTRPVSIDGTTQPGYAGHPVVQIDGSAAGAGANGLTLTGGSSLVRGLAIGGFNGNGIELNTGGINRIAGNYLGTNLAGDALFAIGGHVIEIMNSSNNLIGGTTGTTPGGSCTGDCNLIAGSTGQGIQVEGASRGASSGNQILGNFIGTNAAGNAGLAKVTSNGVLIAGANTVIGDGTPQGRNIISGNREGIDIQAPTASIKGNYIGTNSSGTAAIPLRPFDVNNRIAGIGINGGDHALIENNLISGNDGFAGVFIVGTGGTANTLRGNTIGLNAARNAPLPNLGYGIIIETQANNNVVGGTLAAERNVISDNLKNGILIGGDPAVTGNRVIGNSILNNFTGAPDPGDVQAGVVITNAPGNSIGGGMAGEGNLISGNTGSGVAIRGSSATNNPIFGNSIFANSTIGIDLGADGVTPNDGVPDADTGPNGLQNFPVINSATTTSITGEIFTAPNLNFTIQLFSSDTANHEGKTLLATVVVHTDGAGHASIGPVPVTLASGKWVTGTATDPNGNTSEFSDAVKVP
jgi:hypothetical protein